MNIYIYICMYKGTALPSTQCIKLPEMNVYAKYFDKNNKCISLLFKE